MISRWREIGDLLLIIYIVVIIKYNINDLAAWVIGSYMLWRYIEFIINS